MLADLPLLSSLCLTRTPITDDVFKRLTASKSLRYLTIHHTTITKAEVQEFREANPGIFSDPVRSFKSCYLKGLRSLPPSRARDWISALWQTMPSRRSWAMIPGLTSQNARSQDCWRGFPAGAMYPSLGVACCCCPGFGP